MHRSERTIEHCADRLSFAKSFEDWTADDWSKVLFADETIFPNVFAGQQWCLRRKNEEMLPENLADKVSHPLGINAWGCMSAGGVGTLMTFEETLDGAYMLKILKSCLLESRDKLFPAGDWYFQQDHARSHIDSKVERWLFDKNIPLIVMPPYSPDLNPIELVWAQMKKNVHNRFTKTIQELEDAVIEEWKALPIDFLRNVVHSMPERIQKVIKSNGQRIK
jgi:transposase